MRRRLRSRALVAGVVGEAGRVARVLVAGTVVARVRVVVVEVVVLGGRADAEGLRRGAGGLELAADERPLVAGAGNEQGSVLHREAVEGDAHEIEVSPRV